MVKFFLSYVPVCLLVLIFVHPAFGQSGSRYQPDTPVEIVTALKTDEMPGNGPSALRFIIGPAKNTSEAIRVDFFKAESGQSTGHSTGASKGCLKFFASGSEVSWEGPGSSGKQLQGASLYIIPGASIPMDVLPVNRLLSGSEPAAYEVRSRAGGRAFVDRIRVSARFVNKAEAMRNGWLQSAAGAPSGLHMLEAVDQESGRLIVKQLWASGSAWWFYEETPFRLSWQLR